VYHSLNSTAYITMWEIQVWKKKKKEFLQYVLCLKVCDILLHNKKVSHFYSGNLEVYYFQKVDVWFSKLSEGLILDCCAM